MPYPPEHKPAIRERIVRSARVLFNRNGYNAVSIDAVMKAAGLTRGAFYYYFQNKQALYLEAVESILEDHPARQWPEAKLDLTPERAAYSIVNAYLSDRHCKEIERSCPLVTQAETATRGAQPIKNTYEQILNTMVSGIRRSLKGPSKQVQEKALAVAALCVGGLTLARAAPDEKTARRLLRASRLAALHLLGSP
jgi:AcrR family transcriptional regulator